MSRRKKLYFDEELNKELLMEGGAKKEKEKSTRSKSSRSSKREKVKSEPVDDKDL